MSPSVSNTSSALLSPLPNQPPSYISSPQPLASPQMVPRTPSGNVQTYQGVVPTGQETCPNRVVGNRAMLSPKTQQAPPSSQYRNFVPSDNWAGQEPLVDLAKIRPSAGINPRMPIPQHQEQMSEYSAVVVFVPS